MNQKNTLTYALILVNIIDIIVHVAINQPEALRISGNIVLIIAAIVHLAKPKYWLGLLLATILNLILNFIFIYENGIGTAGIIFISLSTILPIIAIKISPKK